LTCSHDGRLWLANSANEHSNFALTMSSGSTRQQSPTSRPPPAGQCATKATEDCVVGNRNTSMDGKLNESKKVVTSTAEKSQEAHTHTMASKHSKHAAKLPSQVTVNKKGSPIYMKQQETKEKNSKPPSQVSFGAEQRAAPLPSPTNSAPRRARGASSEVNDTQYNRYRFLYSRA